MIEPLPVGTRIVFNQTIEFPADDCRPCTLVAQKGTVGSITGHGTKEGYWVQTDWAQEPFGASADEFDVVTEI